MMTLSTMTTWLTTTLLMMTTRFDKYDLVDKEYRVSNDQVRDKELVGNNWEDHDWVLKY